MVMVFCNSAVTDSSYPAHRALEDVRAMKRIFSSDLLHPLLSNLTIQSKSNIVAYWQRLHHERIVSQQFIIHLWRAYTKMMAKRLNEHGITYEMLKSTFEDNCDDRQAFDSQLHEAGVKRKAWRDKIWDHFTGRKST